MSRDNEKIMEEIRQIFNDILAKLDRISDEVMRRKSNG